MAVYEHVVALVGLGYVEQADARKYRMGRSRGHEQPIRIPVFGGIRCEKRARRA